MAPFFVPPNAGGGPTTERTYRELRDQAEVATGATSREHRIESVLCRRKGHDCLLRVGELDADNGRTVAAIIQVGRATFTVHHLAADPAGPPDPLVLYPSDVYTVTDFQ